MYSVSSKFISLSGLFCPLVLSLGKRGGGEKQLTSAQEGRRDLECSCCSPDPHCYRGTGLTWLLGWVHWITHVRQTKVLPSRLGRSPWPSLSQPHFGSHWCCGYHYPPCASGLACAEQSTPDLWLRCKSSSTWQPCQPAQIATVLFCHIAWGTF